MPSQSYKELKKQISSLRQHLLPSRFDKSGHYRERVFTSVIAFRVLSHAAIEDYIEGRVIDIATKASRHCTTTGDISDPAAHIVSFTDKQFGLPPDTLSPQKPNQNKSWSEKVELSSRVSVSSSIFVRFVKVENHGIREKNLIRLLITVGLRHSDIDPVLISELDNFGELRGQVAHSSTTKHIRTKPNPEDELIKVNNIVELLKDLDGKLDNVLSKIPRVPLF